MIIVGIDLGTSNTVISYFDSFGKYKIIKDNNNYNIKSVISFTKFGKLFGNNTSNINDTNIFISNIKRLIGYNYDDLEINYYKQFQYNIINNENNICIKIDENLYSINEIMIYFLNYVKNLIDFEINIDYKVIITVPAYFNIKQKETIKDCINIVGFNLVKLLAEPISACIAYNNFIDINDGNVLIFDLGGGTLDLSIINVIFEENEKIYDVIATYGDNKFGGSDLTFELMKLIDIENNNLFNYIDQLKIDLNNGKEDGIVINNKLIKISIDEFNKITNNWAKNKIIDNIETILNLSKLTKDKINNVFLVGGSSKLNIIINILENYFNNNSNYKIKRYKIEEIEMEDIAVSYGSAFHGYTLYGKKELMLLDVCPFNIGIETVGGIMIPIINSNSKIPIKRTKQFTTDEDNLTEITIKIYQGDSNFISNNIYLSEFTLNGLPKCAKGSIVINITIEIDSNGLLKVEAYDRKSFSCCNIIIKPSNYKLSEIEINNIKEKLKETKDKEYELFKYIESYNKFIINFDRFVYNLMLNPIIHFDKEFRENVINDIKNDLLEIINNINVELIDIKDFLKNIEILNVDINEKINKKVNITKKINEFNNKLLEKYANFLTVMNNNDQEKKETFCELDDDYLYKIKLVEYVELIQGLLENLDNLPLNDQNKMLLIDYIDIKQNEYQNASNDYKIIENIINDINNYCLKLYNSNINEYNN